MDAVKGLSPKKGDLECCNNWRGLQEVVVTESQFVIDVAAYIDVHGNGD